MRRYVEDLRARALALQSRYNGLRHGRDYVIAAEPITDLDATAADMLEDLDLELNAQGTHLVFAELKDPVKGQLVRFGLQETIDARRFYPTIEAATEAYHREAHP